MSRKLTPKQIKAIYFLAAGMTVTAVAKQLNLRRETVSRWRRIPEFALEFDGVMEEQSRGMSLDLARLASHSMAALERELSGTSYAPNRTQTALNVLKSIRIDRILAPNGSK